MMIPTFGTDIHGNRVKLHITRYLETLHCPKLDLVSLELGEGFDCIKCTGNKFKSLAIPEHIKWLHCDPELFDYDTCKVERAHIYYGI